MTSGTTGLRQGALGPFQIAFFVISAAGPLVAMAGGIPVAMLLGNGPGTPALFLLTSLILLAFSVGYTEMAKDIRKTGAFYAFAAKGFGAITASATGLLALLSYNLLQIGLYGLFGVAAASLATAFGMAAMSWWACALPALALVAALGYRQVDLSARILGALVALEYGVVLVLCLYILGRGGASGLSARPFAPATIAGGAPAIGLMFSFASFVGFEATTIYSEEARDPARTVPFATYLSVILIGGFYTFSTWAIVEGAGPDGLWPLLHALPDPTELLFHLSGTFAPAALSLAMRILFVTSTFASILAFHNAIARYAFAMGREGLLPAKLGNAHHIHYSPHVASLFQSLAALVAIALFALAGADPVLTVFTIPSSLGVLGIITLMAITAAAILCYLLTKRGSRFKPFITGLSFIALLAVAALSTWHFNLLAGKPDPRLALLPAVLPVTIFLGVLLALRLRRADPQTFRRIGQDAAAERPDTETPIQNVLIAAR